MVENWDLSTIQAESPDLKEHDGEIFVEGAHQSALIQ